MGVESVRPPARGSPEWVIGDMWIDRIVPTRGEPIVELRRSALHSTAEGHDSGNIDG